MLSAVAAVAVAAAVRSKGGGKRRLYIPPLPPKTSGQRDNSPETGAMGFCTHDRRATEAILGISTDAGDGGDDAGRGSQRWWRFLMVARLMN